MVESPTESCPKHGTNFEYGCEECWVAFQVWDRKMASEEKATRKVKAVDKPSLNVGSS